MGPAVPKQISIYYTFFVYRTSSKSVRDVLTIPYRFGVPTLAWPLNKT